LQQSQTLNTEFINRLDGIIVPNLGGGEENSPIINIYLKQLRQRKTALGYQLEFTKMTKDFLSAQGLTNLMVCVC